MDTRNPHESIVRRFLILDELALLPGRPTRPLRTPAQQSQTVGAGRPATVSAE
jgi:hypothetical protein